MTAQKQGGPTIYSPHANWLRPTGPKGRPLAQPYPHSAGPRRWQGLDSTQASMGTSSLEPAEASQAFPNCLWAPSLYSPASLAHSRGSPVKQRAPDLGVKGPGCESVHSLIRKIILL